MDLQIAMVAAGGVVVCVLALRALVASWRRARTIDAGEVSSSWVVEQRADRNQNQYS